MNYPVDRSMQSSQLSPAKRALLEQRLRGKAEAHRPRIPRRHAQSAPLSFTQQRLWFLHQLEPDSPVYHIPTALRLQGRLQVGALQHSLQAIAQRHEMLRTRFRVVDGQPVQMVVEAQSLPVLMIDVQHLPPAQQEMEVQRLAIAEAQRPFDLEQGPLVRCTLIQLAKTDYVGLLTLHHIISDGWSTGVLIRELVALYQAAQGQSLPLPDLPIQYADFAVWQRQSLQGEALDRLLHYWRQQLGGELPVLNLAGCAAPKTGSATHRPAQGDIQTWTLPRQLTTDLKHLSQQTGVTLFMLLLAAFKTLLYRYTGQTDILVGSPIANRNHTELEGLIGAFVNTLVFRTDLAHNPPFRDLLQRVREVTLAGYAHQALPFEKLVDDLQPTRTLNQNPLFQTWFSLGNAPMPRLELPDLVITPLEAQTRTAKFDLSLDMTEQSGSLMGRVEYRTDLFDAAAIARLRGHFEQLLTEIVANPDRRLADFSLLTPAEQQQLIGWNQTQVEFDAPDCFPQWFEAQVGSTPDAIAVVYEGQHLTYRELNLKANQLAHGLQALGVTPEVRVGLGLDRSLELAIAILAVLKAGGAYVPLDPSYPAERLSFMLQDAQPAVLLTQQALSDRFSTLSPSAFCLCLDRDWHTVAQQPTTNPVCPIAPAHVAYIIYTSGSTGQPKGAMNTHQGLCNRLRWMQQTYALTAGDRVLQKTPFSFDVSVWELLWPLVVGAQLVMARPGGHQDSHYLAETIARQHITTLHFVPSMLSVFLEEPDLDCRSLKRVFCSGEALPVALQQRYFERFDVPLYNLYGPTEAAIDVTAWVCQPRCPGATVPIGRAIANTQIHLLDAAGRAVPIGVPGELHIGGVQVGRGYWNRPKLTAERFVPDPFSAQPGARLYKTGDLARYLPDGQVEFLGRIDHQVKLRGFRIELGEIEAALHHHPDVQAAAVVVREPQGHRQLVAYVVPKKSMRLELPALRQHLRDSLPDYMVPASWVELDALPLMPNGKINRRALPEPEPQLRSPIQGYVAPRSPLEAQLADIWQQVLHLEQVGIHDNFFELGGDSILSIQIVARSHQAGVQFTPKHLFEHQTIAELAAIAQPVTPMQTEQGAVSGLVPLTPIQQRFVAQPFPHPDHYNQSLLLAVSQRLDPHWLAQAVQHLLRHHDALRLRLTWVDGQWQQVNLAAEAMTPFLPIDLSDLPPDRQTQAIEAATAALQTSLNLAQGPLLRVAWFDLGVDQPGRLFLVIHHMAVDGVSWRILLEDLQTAYRQLSQGQALQLPPKTTAFQQWAQQQRWTTEAEQQQALLDWLPHLPQAIAPLPTQANDADLTALNTEAHARVCSVTLSRDETAALLRQVPQAYRTQINDILLAAVGKTLAQWTQSPTVLIDVEGHGRETDQAAIALSRTVGWFTSVFPVCLSFEVRHSPGETLKAIKEQLRHIPQQGVSYGRLCYLGDESVQEQLRSRPQAQVSFNYLGQLDQSLADGLFQLAPESSGPEKSAHNPRFYLLDVSGFVLEGRLQLHWVYSEQLHEPHRIEQLAHDCVTELRSLIHHCLLPDAGGYTPSDFPLSHLHQSQLDWLWQRDRQIEDLYPLSPVQQGILFHTLYAPGGELYVTQLACTLRGALHESALQRTWQHLIERHPIFRTAFLWELDQPLQCVRQRASLPWQSLDWRSLPSAAQQTQLNAWLQRDRASGLHLQEAPVMRLTLIRLADQVYEFVWTSHHLLLDGWSLPLVFNELFTTYAAFSRGQLPSSPSTRPYRDYITWLQTQDLTAAEAFWRQQFQGFQSRVQFRSATSRFSHDSAPSAQGYAIQTQPLSYQATETLQTFAQRHRLTLNTLVQGAWALMVSRISQSTDVVFGVTSAGRPIDLTGADSMIGLFINTLPARVQIDPQMPLLSWLQHIQTQQLEARRYEYTPLRSIQRWLNQPADTPLFESLVVFENYPVDAAAQRLPVDLEILNVRSVVNNSYPLTLRVLPGEELKLQMMYDGHRFQSSAIAQWLEQLAMLLQQIATPSQPDLSLNHLVMAIPEGTAPASVSVPPSLKGRRRKLVSVSADELVQITSLQPNGSLPALIQPTGQTLGLTAWAKSHRALIESLLEQRGGILFRGFQIQGAADFGEFMQAIAQELMSYTYRSTPRTQVQGQVYTSTEYPPNRTIPLHNEMAYASQYPAKIAFYCVQPAQQGGETPIADSRRVFAGIDPAIRARFQQQGVLYVRNYGGGLDLPWQNVFQTEQRSVVEAYCRSANIDVEWWGNDQLQTRQVCPAIATHPRTGELVWFNQAHLFHVSSLDPTVQQSLLAELSSRLPRHAYYGDGSEIEDHVLAKIRQVYAQETITFSWQAGDVLLLDNLLAAHGRRPFVGSRTVLAGMADPITSQLLQANLHNQR
ncbi:amino acid adenylation domain-containing protein [Leptolyngbya sp. AN02str]|uniref:amino acid adenylation domain-containing protein n=1 Tax=Leptolyngbya sp. AN02str TaxID=3423363 RepID=UPI003D316526